MELDLTNLLSESILEQYSRITEREIEASFELPKAPVLITTEPHSLRRIIDNLLSNAQKYAKNKFLVSLTSDQEQILLTVSNDIKNPDTFDVSKVFEPFYHSSSKACEGSGLGLYVVQCLAKCLGYQGEAAYTEEIFIITLQIPL